MGKYFGNTKKQKRPVKKRKNENNRHRNVIVNFRVSPCEKALIDARIAQSGLMRSTYFIESCLYQKVLVKGNIRSFSAIRVTLQELSEKIDQNPDLTQLDPVDAERIRIILQMIDYLFEGR